MFRIIKVTRESSTG